MHLEIAANLCASRLDIKNVLKFGNVSHVLEKALIIQEKRFIIAKTYEINKGENLNTFVFKPDLAPKMGRPHSIAVSR